jgi:photosystem II stability/assembly factor-like uncharacterized protein
VIALAVTAAGTFAVDLEEGELEPYEDAPVLEAPPLLNLPRLVAAAAAGSTVAAVVDAKPPLLISHDAGSTWRESGRGLPPGRAVAVAATDPDVLVFAARNRLYLSRDGGRFWTALPAELPEIAAVALLEA